MNGCVLHIHVQLKDTWFKIRTLHVRSARSTSSALTWFNHTMLDRCIGLWMRLFKLKYFLSSHQFLPSFLVIDKLAWIINGGPHQNFRLRVINNHLLETSYSLNLVSEQVTLVFEAIKVDQAVSTDANH